MTRQEQLKREIDLLDTRALEMDDGDAERTNITNNVRTTILAIKDDITEGAIDWDVESEIDHIRTIVNFVLDKDFRGTHIDLQFIIKQDDK